MKRITFLLTFLALVLSVSGCAGKSTTQSTATPISAILSPDASASRVNEFQNKANLSLMGATFLALTKLEVTSTDKNL